MLSRLFRRLFLQQLRQAFDAGKLHFFNSLAALQYPDSFASYLAPAAQAEWVVYAKPPFGGSQQVLDYLGRYTHRVAISNNRLVELRNGAVTFAWKDYRHESRHKIMRLDGQEFVRRFLLHVLPTGFQRIRHYGLLANRYREVKLDHCRQLLAAPAPVAELPEAALDYRGRYQRLTGVSLRDCPHCGRGQMVRIESFLPGTLPRSTAHPLMNAVLAVIPFASRGFARSDRCPFTRSRQWRVKISRHANLASPMHTPRQLKLHSRISRAQLSPQSPWACAPQHRAWKNPC